jgi:hydrogenase nickel incorporation protein HypB
MCEECGCGSKTKVTIDSGKRRRSRKQPAGHVHAHGHSHDHPHDHAHPHPHDHQEEHDHPAADGHRVIAVNESVLTENDRKAERNRGYFLAKKLVAVNLLSAPGSGKTALLERTVGELGSRFRMGVIVGDMATDNDARRLRAKGIPVIQIATGTLCHLDADMVGRAMEHLDLDQLDLLVIENVGNLVCPAAFDLGEELRVVLLSVTEGEDKPLKYPPIFSRAHAVIISKSDLAEAVGFKRAEALANIRHSAPQAKILSLSARTGEGMEGWIALLEQKLLSRPLRE